MTILFLIRSISAIGLLVLATRVAAAEDFAGFPRPRYVAPVSGKGQIIVPLNDSAVSAGGPNRHSVELAAWQQSSGSQESQSNGAESSSGSENSEESLRERIAALEEKWQDFEDTQDEEFVTATAAPTMNITGRIHADYWAFPHASEGIGFFENPGTGVDPEDRFFFRRLRIGFQGDILETMFYKLEVDFNEPSEPEYKDMYIGFQELPYIQTLRIGNQKRPLGLDHLNSSRYNVFMERPLVIEAFNEDSRRLGVAAYGVSEDEVFNWQYGVFNLANTSATGGYIGDSYQLSLNSRLAASPWYDETSGGRGYLHLAVSGMLARPDGDASPLDSNSNEGRFRTRGEIRSSERWIDTGRIASAEWYEILGTEAMLNIGPLQIVGEYQNSWLQREIGSNLFFHGAYVYVAYMLTGEHVPYDRESGTIDRLEPFENFFIVDTCHDDIEGGWGAWQIAARFSYLDLSDDDILGGREDNFTLAMNWYWTPYSKMQLNVVFGDIENREPVSGFTAGHFTTVGTRFMVDF